MNNLQKQAALYKLATMQQAISYVLRQRYMRKQADPISMDDPRINPNSAGQSTQGTPVRDPLSDPLGFTAQGLRFK